MTVPYCMFQGFTQSNIRKKQRSPSFGSFTIIAFGKPSFPLQKTWRLYVKPFNDQMANVSALLI